MGAQSTRAQGNSSAFTIVELLIVIVVIAILAVLGIVGYGAVIANANDTSLKEDLAKLGDTVKLATLDNQVVPIGGATAANTGNSAVLSGVMFKPNAATYDLTVANLFYCAGNIDDTQEFTVIARSKTGKAFSYSSKDGIKAFSSSYTWNTGGTGGSICTYAGYTAPDYTWSYGYNPDPQYKWFAWATDGSVIKNLVLNPQGVGSTANFFVPYAGAMTATPGITWNGKTNWYRFVWNGSNYNTNRLMLNLSDLTNGKSYTVSMLVGNDGATARTFWMDFADQGSTNFTVYPSEMKRVYITASRSTYDATYRFVDFNPNEANGTGILVGEVMVTEGTEQYLFRDGTSVGWTWSGAANASTSIGPGQK